MIIVISGCRDAEEINLYDAYFKRLNKLFDAVLAKRQPHTVIVIEGGQRGVDFMAGRIAGTRGCGWACVPANWHKYGRGAGPLRNEWMLQMNVQRVYGLHHDWPNSKGTANCILRARSLSVWAKEITVKT